jgi:hypothetical protein
MSIKSCFLACFVLLSFLNVGVRAETPPAKSDWKLPTPEFRDKALNKSGLDPQVGGWGSAEKDTLYSTARDSTLKDLEEKYPSLPKTGLKSLSHLAKAGAKSKSPTAEGQPKAAPDDVIDKVVNLGPK